MKKRELISKAKSVNLEAKDQIVDQIVAEWDEFEQKLNHLKEIDVKGVKPMHRIDDTPITHLRGDEAEPPFSNAVFTMNAPEMQNGYVVIKRVGKND